MLEHTGALEEKPQPHGDRKRPHRKVAMNPEGPKGWAVPELPLEEWAPRP